MLYTRDRRSNTDKKGTELHYVYTYKKPPRHLTVLQLQENYFHGYQDPLKQFHPLPVYWGIDDEGEVKGGTETGTYSEELKSELSRIP